MLYNVRYCQSTEFLFSLYYGELKNRPTSRLFHCEKLERDTPLPPSIIIDSIIQYLYYQAILVQMMFFQFHPLQMVSTLPENEKEAFQRWLHRRSLILITHLQHVSGNKLILGNTHITWDILQLPALQMLQVGDAYFKALFKMEGMYGEGLWVTKIL